MGSHTSSSNITNRCTGRQFRYAPLPPVSLVVRAKAKISEMEWYGFTKILANDKTWTVISALAAAVAAIAAMITVYHARLTWEKEREAKRPFFIIENPGIKPLPECPPYRIQITMENRGIHMASGLEGRIIIVNAGLKNQPDFDFRFSVANPIPPNSPTPWYIDTVHLPKNLPPQYVVLAIKYEDPVLEKKFGQLFFMRWNGIANGTTHPDFVHVSKDEAIRISDHLKEALNEFIPRHSL